MNDVRPPPHSHLRLAALILLALAVIGSAAWLFIRPGALQDFASTINGWIRAAGPWGGLVIIGLAVVHSVVFFPMELLAIAAGVVFGLWWGSLYVWIGSMLAACLCFWLSRRLGRPFVERMLGRRHGDRLRGFIRQAGPSTLLISRLLPIVAFNLVNYGAGLTPVSWFTYLWTTAIGIVPVLMLSVWFGAMMSELPLQVLLGVSAAGIALILAVRWLIVRARNGPDTG